MAGVGPAEASRRRLRLLACPRARLPASLHPLCCSIACRPAPPPPQARGPQKAATPSLCANHPHVACITRHCPHVKLRGSWEQPGACYSCQACGPRAAAAAVAAAGAGEGARGYLGCARLPPPAAAAAQKPPKSRARLAVAPFEKQESLASGERAAQHGMFGAQMMRGWPLPKVRALAGRGVHWHPGVAAPRPARLGGRPGACGQFIQFRDAGACVRV